MTTCPFCNAVLPAETTRQAACPRCGEIVPTAATNAVVNREEAPSIEERLPNSRIALLVIAAMIVMATIGLIFAIKTIEYRRGIDTRGHEKTGPATVSVATQPTELAGLGYVPADTHVLLGLHVAQLRTHPVGQALLRQFAALDSPPLDQSADHALVALHLKAIPPRVTLIAHSARPIDRSRFAPKSRVERGGRSLERITLPAWKLDAYVLFPDARTLIGSQLPEDFDAVPNSPQPGVERFTHLNAIMRERLDPQAIAWLVGQVEPEMTALPALAGLARIPELRNLRAVSLALRADGDHLAATLDVQGRDADTTTTIVDSLERSLGAAGVIAERKKGGDWQRLTAKLNAEAIAKWFTR